MVIVLGAVSLKHFGAKFVLNLLGAISLKF